MIAAIREATGNPDVKVRGTPWLMMRMLSPFVVLFRELAEMRYLWTTPIHMDNARLIAVLGAEPRTPLAIAVRETLAGMRCLNTTLRHASTRQLGANAPEAKSGIEAGWLWRNGPQYWML
ncbi:MAG: hypothetical protein WDN49_09495 [Acetobacteraceae bacterium]